MKNNLFTRVILPAITVIAVGFSQLAIAQDDSGLRRLTLRSDTLGWEAVGRVDIADRGFCTGVLVRPNVVMTAAHCLFNSETGARRDPTSMEFKAGLRDGRSVAHRRVRRAVVHRNYQYRGGDRAKSIRHDVALLELASPIPASIAAPFKVRSASGMSAQVSVVSYARERSEALSWQKSCGVLGRRSGLLSFSCDVNFGSSGAPVFDMSGRRARIVSLISSGHRDASGSVSYGMEVANLTTDLFADLRSGAGVFPQVGVAAKRVQVNGSRSTSARFLRP